MGDRHPQRINFAHCLRQDCQAWTKLGPIPSHRLPSTHSHPCSVESKVNNNCFLLTRRKCEIISDSTVHGGNLISLKRSVIITLQPCSNYSSIEHTPRVCLASASIWNLDILYLLTTLTYTYKAYCAYGHKAQGMQCIHMHSRHSQWVWLDYKHTEASFCLI